MLANDISHYELIVQYLSGQCDKYNKLMDVINDTTNIKYYKS
jgi:hypothetical protein